MTAYAGWRGTAITRSDVPAAGTKISDMNLINLDFVKAAEEKDRLVKKWQAQFSR